MSEKYRKILVPLDGSPLSEQAIPHALRVAEKGQAQLVLLRVVPHITEQLTTVDTLPLDWKNLDAEQERMASEALAPLEELAPRLRREQVDVQTAIEVGHAADRIVDYAEAHDIDLIVMSTHGRTGVQRWLMGSVAGKVIGAAPCPILLVRAR
ncbi:MAG: universal stress protein [Caldilineaceae bacterium]|nr:universal stress protein [Caldilineaceae bacterium]